MKYFKLIIFFVIVVGCSHNPIIGNIRTNTTNSQALDKKNIAVVINDSLFPNNQKAPLGAGTFNFTNLQNIFINGYRQKFGRGPNKVEFFKNQAPTTGTTHDIYFYPEFKIRMVNDFWTSGCLVKYKLRVSNGSKVLADEVDEYKVTIWSNPVSEGCRKAIEEVFDLVTDRAISRLR